jgi:hypothetical protein
VGWGVGQSTLARNEEKVHTCSAVLSGLDLLALSMNLLVGA